jgi:outer membrane protein assembly factor BamB
VHSEHFRLLMPQIDRYEIGAELGRGGMGIVYHAYERALERDIALKVLAPEIVNQANVAARLRHEAISAARLRHPNIALLYEFGQIDGTPFLAMEYVAGPSLRQLLEVEPIAWDRALYLLAQIADALDYAHAMGIVHRDVKPSNILVDSTDRAVLIDFGLADATGCSLLTADGAVLGTPHYMAPEQADGRGADEQSDQYGLAAVAYELLTGTPPFHGRSTMAVVFAHIHELPVPPTERQPLLPAMVNRVLQRALAKQPEARYPSAAAFVADLQAALAVPAPKRRFWPPSRWRTGLAAGLVLLALTFLMLFLRGPLSGPTPPTSASGLGRSGIPLPQQAIWIHNMRPAGGTALVLQGDSLILDSLDGALLALRADTGAIQWRSKRVGTRETIFGAPSAGAGLIFVGSIDEEVLGLSPDSGEPVWRRQVEGAVQLAPILDQDRLVVSTSKGYLYVLRAGNGQIIWARPLELEMQTPTVSAGHIFVSAGRVLSAIDINSGTISWEFQANSTITTRPVIFGASLLVGTERGVLHALRIANGQELWRTQFNAGLRAAPAVSADAIFAVDRSGGVSRLSADAKRVIWHLDIGAAIDATPLLADGKLFFGANNGIFYALDASDGRLLAQMQLGGSIDTAPAVGNGLIYVRADQIYALGS